MKRELHDGRLIKYDHKTGNCTIAITFNLKNVIIIVLVAAMVMIVMIPSITNIYPQQHPYNIINRRFLQATTITPSKTTGSSFISLRHRFSNMQINDSQTMTTDHRHHHLHHQHLQPHHLLSSSTAQSTTPSTQRISLPKKTFNSEHKDNVDQQYKSTMVGMSTIASALNTKLPFEKSIYQRATTNSFVPDLLKALIQPANSSVKGEEKSISIERLGKEVGWDEAASTLINPSKLAGILSQGLSIPSNTEVHRENATTSILVNNNQRPFNDMMDIVISSTRDLDFLEDWKPFIGKFHLIIIQDGDPTKQLTIPAWADYELYNRNDIDKTLGDKAWIISSKDASIRNFGFLVSDKDYIYTLDDDCVPATKPLSGRVEGVQVNAIAEHMANLLTPAIPHFFNTVYDPYRPGVDFVRGYPYSLRQGVPTAISHGLWMNTYDYDAPTQLLKGSERNTNYADITLTVPDGTLYPMSSMNVAFNKKLIGPAFMQGLMVEGQPWARYDDIFCGWASKVVADHLNVGVKSGAPYIHHNKALNSFTNLKKEYMGLFWQEEVIKFMSNVSFSTNSTSAAMAYLELSDKIEAGLNHLNPHFKRLATAMKLWIEVWEARFGGNHGEYDCYDPSQYTKNAFDTNCLPQILPVASRSNLAPNDKDETCAVFTVTHNEDVMLPIWLRYYTKHISPEHLWVLDHNTNDGSTDPDKIPAGVHYKKLYGEAAWMPHYFLNRQVELHQQRLFRAGYKCVLFTEIDEIVVPDPEIYPGGLKQYFQTYLDNSSPLSKRHAINVRGYHLSHAYKEEASIDVTKPLLQQRKYWFYHKTFSKPLLSKVPLRYITGHHSASSRDKILYDWKNEDQHLVMIHLHSFDHQQCVEREKAKYKGATLHGKRDESALGMNTIVSSHHTLESSLTKISVCGLTMIEKDRNSSEAKAPLGEIVSSIPLQFLKVEI